MEEDRVEDRQATGPLDITSLLIVVIACAMTLVIMRHFRGQAFSVEGIVAGAVLGTIGTVSGKIFGSVRHARTFAIGGSMLSLLAVIVGGARGDRFILWSIACLTTGLLIGLLFSRPEVVAEEPSQEEDDADPERDRRWDDEQWDVADWRT